MPKPSYQQIFSFLLTASSLAMGPSVPLFKVDWDRLENIPTLGLELLPLEWPFSASKEPKIQRKWPKFDTQFCFGHNFWSDAYFSIPFSLVIYIYPARCMETNIDHILWPFQTKPEWLFWVILAIFYNLAMIAWLDMALNMVHVGFLCI